MDHARFRIRSGELLFELGENIVNKVKKADPADPDEVLTFDQLLIKKQGKGNQWSHNEIGAEIAGEILATTETT
ncbi:hypothetical protein N8I77_007524 [Diaporthe amygdali]|uniref:Uncharacterized protein n=1 Tax=Phomopsis amygdali TaxID=1214568 RepID=A0AAD9W1N3_PHOAM|nr:hypothetical protein N8I77_007524 [Diaporthe amygdali]